MTKRWWRWFIIALILTAVFVAFTITVKYVGTQNIGTQTIGWAAINFWWRDLVGVQNFWQITSHIFAAVTFIVLVMFLVWQALALLRRKSFRAMPHHWWFFDLTLIALALCYIVFQIMVINFRPLLIDGVVELSYPSSHVLLLATLWPVFILTLSREVKNRTRLRVASIIGVIVMVVGIIARTLSGYHWLTDILGGILLGIVLTAWYQTLTVRYNLSVNPEPDKI
ncbi:MAG: phosphatase PAP2 family protein [Clostridia bacterium]|nr:phosphatase PAP2 family protein [Clostridia bacterium]